MDDGNSITGLQVHSYGEDGKALYERTCSGCGLKSLVKKRYLSMKCHGCAMKSKRENLSPGSVQQQRGGVKVTLYERECRGCGIKTMAAKRDRDRMCRQCALKARATHGLSSRNNPHPLYRVLKSAVSRCTHERSKDYKRYGARGISVCDEWMNNPELFVSWAMDNGYRAGLDLDRRDNDGNYSPDNCRFITHADNCRNKANTSMSAEMVKQIRAYAAESGSIKLTAAHFEIPISTASGIIRRTSWVDVD